SDGNVHAHIDHLIALLGQAAREGVTCQRVHVLTDGRDVDGRSALRYLERLEAELAALREAGCDARIASGGGRMLITMDRYGADWAMVERGWQLHVRGEGPKVASARAAVEAYYASGTGDDQYVPGFVVADERGEALGPIRPGASVVLFNFRGDRAIELTQAFEQDHFDRFARGPRLDLRFAGMMQYDGDLKLPTRFLVEPPRIRDSMGELLALAGRRQLAIAETHKYGHVTYFWNGNRSGMFDEGTETYIEIPSDRVPFEQRPWMKAAEITDRLIIELRTGKHRFARVNYANGDMVGHTGSFDATVLAVETVDLELARLVKAVEELQGIVVVTADHGNADEMYQRDKKGRVQRDKAGQPVAKTSHTLNPVPFLIHDPMRGDRYDLDPARAQTAGIANVTATCIELLGFVPPDDLESSLLRFR
ncbi:MAG: 2,3-bisphosphoglycerate-independent phosphoglycerate mutase, partial [Acidobacteriota bacterium]